MSFLPDKVNRFRLSRASIADKLYITYKCYINYPPLWTLKNDLKFAFSTIRKQASKIKKLIKRK
jgi:hypothetical protein